MNLSSRKAAQRIFSDFRLKKCARGPAVEEIISCSYEVAPLMSKAYFLSHYNFHLLELPKIPVRPALEGFFSHSFLSQSSSTMGSKFLAIAAIALIALCSTALGQTNFTTNWNPTGEGCVDTTGFLSCYDDQGAKGTSCTNACATSNKKGSSAYNTCVNGCEQLWLADNVGCWIQSCWNQVCSCPT